MPTAAVRTPIRPAAWPPVVGALLSFLACSPCPRPSIVGVPPQGPERLELALPLDSSSRATIEAFLKHCGPDGAALCENELTPEQRCVLDKLQTNPPPSSREGALELAACSSTPGFTLEIRDARGDEGHVLRGAAVLGSVFVVHTDGLPPTYDRKPMLTVFPDYVPAPAP